MTSDITPITAASNGRHRQQQTAIETRQLRDHGRAAQEKPGLSPDPP